MRARGRTIARLGEAVRARSSSRGLMTWGISRCLVVSRLMRAPRREMLGAVLLLVACKRDAPARAEVEAQPAADLAPLAVLGRARSLSAGRAELVVVPKSEIVAEDVGADAAPRSFVLGVL